MLISRQDRGANPPPSSTPYGAGQLTNGPKTPGLNVVPDVLRKEEHISGKQPFGWCVNKKECLLARQLDDDIVPLVLMHAELV